MIYNIHSLKILFESGDIDKARWRACFPDVPENRVPTCKDCRNRNADTCGDDTNPVDCFLYGLQSRPNGTLEKNTTIR